MRFEKEFLYNLFKHRTHSVIEDTVLASGEIIDHQLIFYFQGKYYRVFYGIEKHLNNIPVFLNGTIPTRDSFIDCDEVIQVTICETKWIEYKGEFTKND